MEKKNKKNENQGKIDKCCSVINYFFTRYQFYDLKR